MQTVDQKAASDDRERPLQTMRRSSSSFCFFYSPKIHVQWLHGGLAKIWMSKAGEVGGVTHSTLKHIYSVKGKSREGCGEGSILQKSSQSLKTGEGAGGGGQQRNLVLAPKQTISYPARFFG